MVKKFKSVYLDDAVLAKIKAIALKEDRSVNYVIAKLIEEALASK